MAGVWDTTTPQLAPASRGRTDGVMLHSGGPKGNFLPESQLHTQGQSVKKRSSVQLRSGQQLKKGRRRCFFMETSNASPVNYLCVQAAELDSCEEKHVCLVGALERKGPLYRGQRLEMVWPGGQGSWEPQQLRQSPNPSGNAPVSRRGSQRAGTPIPAQTGAQGGLHPEKTGAQGIRCEIPDSSEAPSLLFFSWQTQTHPSRSNSKDVSFGKATARPRQSQFLLLLLPAAHSLGGPWWSYLRCLGFSSTLRGHAKPCKSRPSPAPARVGAWLRAALLRVPRTRASGSCMHLSQCRLRAPPGPEEPLGVCPRITKFNQMPQLFFYTGTDWYQVECFSNF